MPKTRRREGGIVKMIEESKWSRERERRGPEEFRKGRSRGNFKDATRMVRRGSNVEIPVEAARGEKELPRHTL